eukprot:TRINITY_DN469_c0_g1_i17.p1 TRINITY_DN469_c0_g1~~TRINITY_DN469_c0_g1_i17.p1  ORF type:complete len:218 (+),score=39.78 TRINITY_DN469_c0_g1_i17:79-732(+)
MKGLFGKKQKTPQEIVKHVKEGVQSLEKEGVNSKSAAKYAEQLSQDISAMKSILYDSDPHLDSITILTTEICSSGVLLPLVNNLPKLEFETKKDLVSAFNNLLRRQVGTHYPVVDYILANQNFVVKLIQGYENPDIALNCGSMLREVVRHEALAKQVLEEPSFWNFFQFVETSNFDIASDAFASFKVRNVYSEKKTIQITDIGKSLTFLVAGSLDKT